MARLVWIVAVRVKAAVAVVRRVVWTHCARRARVGRVKRIVVRGIRHAISIGIPPTKGRGRVGVVQGGIDGRKVKRHRRRVSTATAREEDVAVWRGLADHFSVGSGRIPGRVQRQGVGAQTRTVGRGRDTRLAAVPCGHHRVCAHALLKVVHDGDVGQRRGAVVVHGEDQEEVNPTVVVRVLRKANRVSHGLGQFNARDQRRRWIVWVHRVFKGVVFVVVARIDAAVAVIGHRTIGAARRRAGHGRLVHQRDHGSLRHRIWVDLNDDPHLKALPFAEQIGQIHA